MYGTAIGDALGYVCEFDKSAQPISGLDECLDRRAGVALYSDDTQMFLATVDGMFDALKGAAEAPFLHIDDAAQAIAKRYVAWSKSPENNRAPGGACMYGCRNLAEGIAWTVSGKPEGKGCGAAMRSMAYSLFLNMDRAEHWAAEHALMTHRDPTAQASAAAVAAGVRAALMGFTKPATAAVMVAIAAKYDSGTAEMLNQAIAYADERSHNRPMVLDKWRGWRGDEAVAASLFCYLIGGGYADSVLFAINSPGDSDSLGAITGALAGATYGAGVIPRPWIGQIENTELLARTSEQITKHWLTTKAE